MRKLLFLSAMLCALGLAGKAWGAAPPTERERTLAESLRAVDRLVASNIDRAGPGVAVAVMQGGKVVFQKGYGLADLKTKAPITTTTTFELASVSKPFTAFAILILAERGKLGLDDDVRKYVPELPVHDTKRPIRIRDLLQHTSGVPTHLRFFEVSGISSGTTTADFVKKTATRKLDFPTGSKWEYSNMNYRLLAVVVERVSGKSFPAFLKAEVFVPLGMKHTFVRDPRQPVAGQAVGYTPGLGIISSWKYSPFETKLLLVGEAGVWSCVEDMARWEQELRRPTLVKRASLERAWVAGRLDNGKPIPYGLGWFVHDTAKGRKLSHSGGWPGFTTYFLRYPERDVAVVVLTNLSGSLRAVELAERSGNLLVDRPRSGGPKLTEAQMKALAGAYQREGKLGPARMEVVRREDGLYLVMPGQLPFPLLPVSPTRFRIDGTPSQYLTFELEDGGARRARLELKGGRPLVAFVPRTKPGQVKAAKRG